METIQMSFWSGEFGKNYTDRNTTENIDKWNLSYTERYGISRFDMFHAFMDGLPKDMKILEVGCNVGLQLAGLQKLGFKNLYGIELQQYAVERAKQITSGINIIQGSAFDIPFKDNFFDLVMTNGLLIHIAPKDLNKAFLEINRCTKQFIMGFEYYSENIQPINYRGHDGFLWKMNFAAEYQKVIPNLKLIKEIHYPYITEQEKGNIDTMFLLQKT